jgi:hypothetical protein
MANSIRLQYQIFSGPLALTFRISDPAPLVTSTEADAAVDVALPLKKSFLNTAEHPPNGMPLPVEIDHQTPGPVLRSHSIPQVSDQIPSQPYRAPPLPPQMHTTEAVRSQPVSS